LRIDGDFHDQIVPVDFGREGFRYPIRFRRSAAISASGALR
jgi:hypothetical protein